jgi:hypothetical protein
MATVEVLDPASTQEPQKVLSHFYIYLSVTVPDVFVRWKTLWGTDEAVLLLAEAVIFP